MTSKISVLSRVVSVAVLGCSLPVLAAAQVPRNRAALPGEQWVQLFNGKDLTNWVEVGKEKWTVEDGTIHGQGVTSAYGYLRTEKTYKDFWMSLRFKCEADGNSGLYFHTDFKPGTVDVSKGMQFEIDRTLNHHTGGLYGDGRNWIAWPAPEFEQVIRPTDWNELLVKVEGQPHGRGPQRRRGAQLHRSHAEVVRRLHRPAAALGRAGQHAVQGHLRARSVDAPASSGSGLRSEPEQLAGVVVKQLSLEARLPARRRMTAMVCEPWHPAPEPSTSLQSLPKSSRSRWRSGSPG